MKRAILLLPCVGALGLLALSSSCGDDTCEPEVGTICTIVGIGENGYDRDADNIAIPALEAKFSLPQDTLTGPDGQIYILDWNNHRLRVYDEVEGTVAWVAGRGELGGSLDDPANGDFNHPTNMIFDPSGKIIMAAWHNSKIRVVDPATGVVTDSCGDGGRAYFGDGGDARLCAQPERSGRAAAECLWRQDHHLSSAGRGGAGQDRPPGGRHKRQLDSGRTPARWRFPGRRGCRAWP